MAPNNKHVMRDMMNVKVVSIRLVKFGKNTIVLHSRLGLCYDL
jgi:hypothetical protein